MDIYTQLVTKALLNHGAVLSVPSATPSWRSYYMVQYYQTLALYTVRSK